MNTARRASGCYLDEPFFQVPRTLFQSSRGPVELPILYYDTTAVQAFFLAERGRVEQLLAGTGLEPALTVGGRALVGIACFEYRDTSVGVYNEVGVALAVCRQGTQLPLGGWRDMLAHMSDPESRQVAFHIVDLPVTTAEANAAGREIWGYPKFVTRIPFRLQDGDFACSVMEPGTDMPIMELAGKFGPSIPMGPMSLTLLSFRDQHLVRATVNVRGTTRLAAPGNVRLKVFGSGHPMGERLMALGLDGARPLAIGWTDRFQSRLNAGAIIDG